MPVSIKGTGGGGVTLDAGAAASATTLTLPNVSGTVLQSGTTVTVAQGGTGATSLTANNVLLGNGTSAVQVVAPGANGNLLTSNGTTWTSAAPAASVTALAAGTGISVSGSTGSVTVSNTGVTSAVAGTGVGVSAATGSVTFTNTGVTSLTTSSGLSTNTSATGAVSVTNTGALSVSAGTGISVNATTGNITVTNAGVTSAAAGTGISVSGSTGGVTFTNTGVTSLTAGTGISLSGSTGGVTVSITGGGFPIPSAIGQIPFSTDGSTYTATQKITQGTAVASTSGTSIDFTSIPSWVKRVTVMFAGVSTSATSPVQIQLGTSGGPTTSGYLGTVYGLGASGVLTAYSAGFLVDASSTAAAASIRHGQFIFDLVTGNTWVGSGTVGLSNANYFATGAGAIALSGALDRVRITTVGGTDTFDAGSINILYE